MSHESTPQTLYAGRHITMFGRHGWEFVSRNTRRPAVGIVAITDDERVVLVEQFRPPVGRKVVELPAGLAGDISGQEGESLLLAAQRELLEETGYAASRWTELGVGYSSPGLTDESIVLFLAEGLQKVEAGGGDGTESITIHEPPLANVAEWLAAHGAAVDLKLWAGVFAAQEARQARGNQYKQK
ncbi:NUDIX hydrolase [Lacipirellula parvula]|uniref:GDP-mannose pyrophosphatase n=1 Tax=Lacipirellula parvula TaxID=2650471 RepID=A0A5K7XHT9_9BACT|nr:NUDIX hydrolase [Lacipirellula parvula]BBO35612.1 ADP-ribose pyrophosphatase [Lacipirellula parvula]